MIMYILLTILKRTWPILFVISHDRSSLVTSKTVHDDTLDFAARHGNKPVLQVFKYKQSQTVIDIMQKLREGRVKYRPVLEF